MKCFSGLPVFFKIMIERGHASQKLTATEEEKEEATENCDSKGNR